MPGCGWSSSWANRGAWSLAPKIMMPRSAAASAISRTVLSAWPQRTLWECRSSKGVPQSPGAGRPVRQHDTVQPGMQALMNGPVIIRASESHLERKMNVTIIGTGYVGITTGLSLAYLGHDVTCIDKNPDIIARLRRGEATIHEPGLEELLAATSARFEQDIPLLEGRGVVVIAVGTPTKENGDADMRYVDAAAREVAERIQPGAELVVVNKSTVPIGSARHVEAIIERTLNERGVEADVYVASNPEFLAG